MDDEGAAGGSSRRRLLTVGQVRLRQGRARVRAAWFPVVQAAVAGGIAYWLAMHLLGHAAPFFAPVSAWVALGFSRDRSLRRVAELAVGVAIGVGLGDLLVHVIGSGVWQIPLVLCVAALVARFVDRGQMLTTQAGVQAIVIVGLPALGTAGGSLGRWTDALLGGAMALLVAVLTPSDPRAPTRRLARNALSELAGVLGLLARGLAAHDETLVEDALVRGRASQPALDEWKDSAASAHELARVSPAGRRHRAEIGELRTAAVLVDRAMRNTRVLVRRSVATVTSEHQHRLDDVAATVQAVALAAGELGSALGDGRDPAPVRDRLERLAAGLDPYAAARDDWQVQSLVLLLRSLVVDLLEVAGATKSEAHAALPAI